MDDQLTIAALEYAAKKKRTKRGVFLPEMDQIVPWARLEAVIEPHYPKAVRLGGIKHALDEFPIAQWVGCRIKIKIAGGWRSRVTCLDRGAISPAQQPH